MRDKELRIALVCYGGVSLAVYMHGVTKEIWKLARASRAMRDDEERLSGSESGYLQILREIRKTADLRLRVLPDILTGASAGGMNAIFLAEGLLTGKSLDPLTSLWLDCADSDVLIAPEARPGSKLSKFWAQPLVEWTLRRPGNAVARTVAPETRDEVREKLSRLMRSRWFAPPFSGIGFSRLIDSAFAAMTDQDGSGELVPYGHPIDLFVTATDFRGYRAPLRIHSPPFATEGEHRLSISFRALGGAETIAERPELVLAARATASFPGAFPPLKLEEIDRLAREREIEWRGREAFLHRIMPHQIESGTLEHTALIDGAVLVGAPFSEAIGAVDRRPSVREVDRRFIYIDPHPASRGFAPEETKEIGFFTAIFGALSSIPREQPIRDNLEKIAERSQHAARLRAIVDTLREEVEWTIDKLLGRTLFLNRPTAERLTQWRRKAQQAAAERAGFAYHGYAQAKFASIVESLAGLIHSAIGPDGPPPEDIVTALTRHLEQAGLSTLSEKGIGANEAAIAFFRTYDVGFRVRRLRHVLQRLSPGEIGGELSTERREHLRDAVYRALALYNGLEQAETIGPDFRNIARDVLTDPGSVLAEIAKRSDLAAMDPIVDAMLVDALGPIPREQRRRILLAYMGFPFYDIVTLPLLGSRERMEYDPIKVDRISPEDATSIRDGGAEATLRGIEFYNFGAFFSRAYRENDYLWGRLHGAERLVDIMASTLDADNALPGDRLRTLKRDLFLAILDEELESGQCRGALVQALRAEVEQRLSGD